MAYKIVNDDSLTSVANAIRVQGSISGTLEFPDGFVSAIQNLSPSPTLQAKTKTYTPTTSQQTESVVADSGYDGLDEVDVTVNAIPSQYKDTTDATATADKILSGYTAYANGQKLTGTASGGITPSGTISITQNGQVDVTNYATADVNVSGGGGSSYHLVDSREFQISTTSTSTQTVASYTIDNDGAGIRGEGMLMIVIRDKQSGYRYNYFACNVALVLVNNSGGGTQTLVKIGGKWANTGITTGSGNYGVYPSISGLSENSVTININTRYSNSYGTINSTYVVDVYRVDYPPNLELK